MRKVLVFQHAAHEILGTLNPLLKQKGLRVRYVNFERDPASLPTIEKYDGLIILGGAMGVYEADRYKHLQHEVQIIEKALLRGLPILGICLGAQLLAHALGARVWRNDKKEMGWEEIQLSSDASTDPVLKHFAPREHVFQMHGDTFDLPVGATRLASSAVCPQQAFRHGDKAYGLQFHLEVDEAMIERWLQKPSHLEDLRELHGADAVEKIRAATKQHLTRSLVLSRQTFAAFLAHFGEINRHEILGSEHGKPTR